MCNMNDMSLMIMSIMTAESFSKPVGIEERNISSMSAMPQMTSSPRGLPSANDTLTRTQREFASARNLHQYYTRTLTFTAEVSSSWIALYLVNARYISRLSISLDGHSMFLYTAHGLYITLLHHCQSGSMVVSHRPVGTLLN